MSIPAVLVPWESGYPVVCKITYSGSIPLGTSTYIIYDKHLKKTNIFKCYLLAAQNILRKGISELESQSNSSKKLEVSDVCI